MSALTCGSSCGYPHSDNTSTSAVHTNVEHCRHCPGTPADVEKAGFNMAEIHTGGKGRVPQGDGHLARTARLIACAQAARFPQAFHTPGAISLRRRVLNSGGPHNR